MTILACSRVTSRFSVCWSSRQSCGTLSRSLLSLSNVRNRSSVRVLCVCMWSAMPLRMSTISSVVTFRAMDGGRVRVPLSGLRARGVRGVDAPDMGIGEASPGVTVPALMAARIAEWLANSRGVVGGGGVTGAAELWLECVLLTGECGVRSPALNGCWKCTLAHMTSVLSRPSNQQVDSTLYCEWQRQAFRRYCCTCSKPVSVSGRPVAYYYRTHCSYNFPANVLDARTAQHTCLLKACEKSKSERELQ